jgi:hypothetical protein
MHYIISKEVFFEIREDDESKEYIQMDQIMKRLFTLKNKKPIIDFLNAVYVDDLSYDAKISYSNTENINTRSLSVQYVSFHADIFITAEEGNNVFEYAIEFQTVFEKDITIRMFRYSFERAVKLDYYRDKNTIRLKFPEPYIILLEEEKDVLNEFTLEIEIPKQDVFSFNIKVLKYWEYNLNKLYKENMYLLYPLQIFSLRKAMEGLKGKSNSSNEHSKLYEQLKLTILHTLEAIDNAYKDGKIDINDYNEMTTILVNLNSYLLNVYKLQRKVEEEVNDMVKSFYDPKVEQRGIEKGLRLTAENMIKDGDTNEKIKRCTGLDETVITELRKLLEAKGEH